MKHLYAIIFTIFLTSLPVHAQDTKFIFPAACSLGTDCWTVNYVDVDPKEALAMDFRCGPKTYDTHKGTDFALASVSQMKAGVDVVAAADGRVLRFRDGESDRLKGEEEIAEIKEMKKECGNGILIDHGNGLQSIYCHLKQDSIAVEAKEKVKAGQKIAEIGQSGLAEFPHLHFGVLWEGGIIDPYTGVLNTKGCDQYKDSLWHAGLKMEYEPVAIFDGGFRNTTPDFEAIKRGEENPSELPLNSAAFVFWVGFYNVEVGDQVYLKVTDPDGQTFVERRETLDKNRARQYYFTGRKIGRVQLKSGTYTGTVSVTRSGDQGIKRDKRFTVRVQ